MPITRITVHAEESGGEHALQLNNEARWVLPFAFVRLAGGSGAGEVKIHHLNVDERRLVVASNIGDGTHWETTIGVDSAATEIIIEVTRGGGGFLTVSSPVDNFTHRTEPTPRSFNLRLK